MLNKSGNTFSVSFFRSLQISTAKSHYYFANAHELGLRILVARFFRKVVKLLGPPSGQLASSTKLTTLRHALLPLVASFILAMPLWGQTPVTTWHYDNARTAANTTETLLTPANVNFHTFGKLFTQPVDGFIVGHSLYLPGITIPGQGTHNVVYVATMHDSVYAFDADTPNVPPLWTTSILTYSPAGATPVPVSVKKGSGTTGWTEVGIISTPVIDATSGTLYVLAETYENGNVVHRLHALDVTTGQEKFGGPATIAATYTLNGTTSTFRDLYQMNRPGLLLANGHIYIAFGSNCCNDYSQGWVMSYNAATLQQEGTFDAEPGNTLASIWQKGAGISADSNGNVYAETGEGNYVPGTNLSTSVLKLSQVGTSLSLSDWFTPYNYDYLSSHDLDLAESVTILPDQPGPVPHEAIAIGKQGTVYVLNRDNMGQLCSNCTNTDSQIVQELTQAVGYESGSPVYWNNTVYFTGAAVPVMAFTLNNGLLSTPPSAQSIKLNGSGHGFITANGKNNGILWFVNGKSSIFALDATSLKVLYNTNQAPNGRDTVPTVAHFATPVAADGKVFMGTQASLVVYGLLPTLSVIQGNSQSAEVASVLPQTLEVQATDSYSKAPITGVTVTFSDGSSGGSFNPASVVTDQNGTASTSYTLPTKSGSYGLTASATGYAPGIFSETALPGPATALIRSGGNLQSAPVVTQFPSPLVTKAKDSYGNGVPGVAITYTDKGAGGTFSANPVTTDSTGRAAVSYTTATKAGALKIIAKASGVSSLTFSETVTAGPAANIGCVSGNNQTAPPNTQLSQPLSVIVTDQYGNAVSGIPVNWDDGGAGGTFSTNPVLTSSNGIASVYYTTPSTTGTLTVSASVSGLSTWTTFTVNVQ